MSKMRMMTALLLVVLLAFAGVAQAEGFTGEAQGFGGAVAVTLTMDGDKIADVAIEGAQETEAIGGAAFGALAEQILSAQSAEIDGVAGATVTSNAVKEATAKALAGAKGETEAEVKLVPGTYTSTQESYQHMHVTVSVTVDEKSIVDVEVVEATDNPKTVAGVAWEQIPAAIEANQTYNVDAVTGATVTSNAIKMAVRDCLEQAGGSAAFSKVIEKPEIVAGEDVQTDVLVIGGGGAGLMAAIEAYIDTDANSRSNLNVMVVEKTAILGGSTGLSGGRRYYYADETGAYDDAWLDSVLEKEVAHLQSNNNLPVNKELVRSELKIMKQVNELIPSLGIPGEPEANGTWLFDNHVGVTDGEKWSGNNFTYFMNGFLPTTEIDVRMNTAATKLITDENGAVIGASVTDKASTYNVYAKKVILACGGFPHDQEMIAKYAPEYVGTLAFAAGGNTGDGIRMATEIGAVTVGDSMLGYLGSDSSEGIWPDYAFAYCFGTGIAMDINVEGERFCNESLSPNKRYYEVLQQPEDMAWGIVDSNNPEAGEVYVSQSPYVYKADSIEALADMIGVPADKLAETTNAYNAAFDAGHDEAFGCPVERMDRVDAAPYYAFLLRPVALSSLVGLDVDDECRVVNASGEVIENLYAAGDLVLGGHKLGFYTGARGVGTAIYTGSLAGVTAKNDLLAK